MRKHLSGGFTLIELLLSAVLVPLIGFAIYANFNSGIKVWQRLHQQDSVEDLIVFTQKVSRNFDSAVKYAPIPFLADKESVSFMALIQTDDKLGGERGIGQVHIFYDSKSNTIKREILNLSQIYKNSSPAPETLIAHAGSFHLSYFVLDKEAAIYHWTEEWVDRPNELPVAVRLEFTWSGLSGSREIKKTFSIPAGGWIEKT